MPARRVVALTRAAIAVRLVADVFVLAVLGEATAVAVEVLADVAGTGVTAARTAILATIGGGGAVAAEGDYSPTRKVKRLKRPLLSSRRLIRALS